MSLKIQPVETLLLFVEAVMLNLLMLVAKNVG